MLKSLRKTIEPEEQFGLKQYDKYIYDPNPMGHNLKQEELISSFTENNYEYITEVSHIYPRIIDILSEETDNFSSFCFNDETAIGISTEQVIRNLKLFPAIFFFIKNTNILHSTILFNVKNIHTVNIDSFCVNQIRKLKGGKEVLEEFINIVKKTGFQNIQLNSIITAVDFYKKLGFHLDNPSDITETPSMTKNLQMGGKRKKTVKNRNNYKNKTIKKIYEKNILKKKPNFVFYYNTNKSYTTSSITNISSSVKYETHYSSITSTKNPNKNIIGTWVAEATMFPCKTSKNLKCISGTQVFYLPKGNITIAADYAVPSNNYHKLGIYPNRIISGTGIYILSSGFAVVKVEPNGVRKVSLHLN
jgi:hypothetical protein